MIPDGAIIAAARAWVGEQVWQNYPPAWQADHLERVQVLLEAAAPHMTRTADVSKIIEELRASGWHEAADLVGQITEPAP